MGNNDVDFDRFVKAVQDAGLRSSIDGGEAVDESENIPLTHTSGVTPKDWERVQKSLEEKR